MKTILLTCVITLGIIIISVFIVSIMDSFFISQLSKESSFTEKELHLDQLYSLIEENKRADKLLAIALPGYKKDAVVYSIKVTATSYNPLEKQCDKTPLIDSNNKLVMPGTIAVPKKFREKIGIKLGQIVLLDGFGLFTVTGHMNNRFKDEPKVDIISFIPEWSKKFGVHKKVRMYWWN